jgi:type I restriction enzyme R subunit
MAQGKVKNFISEDDIELALLQHLQHLHGFDVLNCFTAKPDELNDGSHRQDKRDVILVDRLRDACIRLNPAVPDNIIDEQVLPKLMDRRIAMSPIKANRELDELIRNGVQVVFEDKNGVKQDEKIKLIDFPSFQSKGESFSVTKSKNHYIAVQQLWIKSSVQAPYAGYRRPDIILYVNGLPLVFVELKNSNVKLRSAYDDN